MKILEARVRMEVTMAGEGRKYYPEVKKKRWFIPAYWTEVWGEDRDGIKIVFGSDTREDAERRIFKVVEEERRKQIKLVEYQPVEIPL